MSSPFALLVLLGLLLNVVGQAQSPFACMLYRDNYIYFEKQEEVSNATVTLNMYIFDRRGWFGLAFGNTKDVKNANFVLVTQFPGVFYQPSNSTHFTKVMSSNFTYQDAVSDTLNNHMVVTLRIPPSLFNTTYIFLARSDKDLKDNLVIAPYDTFEFKWNGYSNSSYSDIIGHCQSYSFKIPGRGFAYHPASFAICLLFYFLVFFGQIYYRKSYPLKARSFGPPLLTFVFSFNLIIEFTITWGLTYEQSQAIGCFTSAFLLYPSFEMIILMPSLIFIRYLSILNVNIAKSKINKAGYAQIEKKLPFYIKILNRMKSGRILIAIPMIAYINLCIIAIILFLIFGWQCGTPALLILRYIHFAIVFLMGMICILALVIDMLVNIKRIAYCHCRDHFVKQDPFGFRLEYFWAPLAILFGIGWFISTFVSPFARVIIIEIHFCCMLLLGGTHALIVTFVKDMLSKCLPQDPTSNSLMEKVLVNPELSEMFLTYAESEWAGENFYFQQSIIEYKRSGQDKRYELAKKIMSVYLIPSEAIYEINVTKTQFDEINQKLGQKADDLPTNLFETVEREVMQNLTDTFSRFVMSHEYKVHMSKLKMLGIILE